MDILCRGWLYNNTFLIQALYEHSKLSAREPPSASHMSAFKEYSKPICCQCRNNLWNLNKLTSFWRSAYSAPACTACSAPQRQLYEIWMGYTDCLPRYLVGTHVQCRNLNRFMNMEQSSWNFRTVKQLVTQNVSINFCPHKPEIQNSETMINLAGPAHWQLCGAPEERPANCVLHV